MDISIPGDNKIIGGSATSGDRRTLGDTSMIARHEDRGMVCPITTLFIKGRSASYDVNASGALATIAVANTAANRQEREPSDVPVQMAIVVLTAFFAAWRSRISIRRVSLANRSSVRLFVSVNPVGL